MKPFLCSFSFSQDLLKKLPWGRSTGENCCLSPSHLCSTLTLEGSLAKHRIPVISPAHFEALGAIFTPKDQWREADVLSPSANVFQAGSAGSVWVRLPGWEDVLLERPCQGPAVQGGLNFDLGYKSQSLNLTETFQHFLLPCREGVLLTHFRLRLKHPSGDQEPVCMHATAPTKRPDWNCPSTLSWSHRPSTALWIPRNQCPVHSAHVEQTCSSQGLFNPHSRAR